MKNTLVGTLIGSMILMSLSCHSQDVVFVGTSLRVENTTIGINIGAKKDFGNFGALIQFNLYPYRLETENSITTRYLTYKDFTLSGIYNFSISNQITVYPIVGLAFNLVRSKAKVKSILQPELERDFTKGKTQSSIGGTFGVGGIYRINDQWNVISDLRYDASDYTSLKFMIGAAFSFSTSEKLN